MASTNVILRDQFPAGADLSTKRRTFVKLNSSGQAVSCGAGDGGWSLSNTPVSGEAATVDLVGESKITLGGTVAYGALIASDAAGKAVTATTGAVINGVCLQGGVSGDIVTFLAAVPTTVKP